MKQYKLGIATDKARVHAALKANPANEYTNPDILDYPKSVVLKAYDGDEEHYLPMQVVMLESISAHIPANALRDLVKGAQLWASSHGIKELYFLDGGGGLDAFAERRGFEVLPYKVFRMKL